MDSDGFQPKRSEKVTFRGVFGQLGEVYRGFLLCRSNFSRMVFCKTVYRTVCKPFCKRCAASRKGNLDKRLPGITVKEL